MAQRPTPGQFNSVLNNAAAFISRGNLRQGLHSTERSQPVANSDRNFNFFCLLLVRAIQLCPFFQFFAKSEFYGFRKIKKLKAIGQSKEKFAY
jgi:hypothetical protein